MFFLFLVGGFRYIIIVSILASVVLPYIVERKGLAFRKAIILFFILLIMCDLIAGMRGTIRTGKSVDFEKIQKGVKLEDVFDSDLTIFQPFYCVVEKIPGVLPYQKGKGLIGYSIFSFFPRAIFRGKINLKRFKT